MILCILYEFSRTIIYGNLKNINNNCILKLNTNKLMGHIYYNNLDDIILYKKNVLHIINNNEYIKQKMKKLDLKMYNY